MAQASFNHTSISQLNHAYGTRATNANDVAPYNQATRIDENILWWNYSGAPSKEFIMDINNQSLKIFKKTMCCGADSINIYSIDMLALFQKIELLFPDIIKLNHKYKTESTYYIGTILEKFDIYLIKIPIREIIFEKINNTNSGEKWNLDKRSTIELYSKEFPQYSNIIKIEGLHNEQNG